MSRLPPLKREWSQRWVLDDAVAKYCQELTDSDADWKIHTIAIHPIAKIINATNTSQHAVLVLVYRDRE